MLRRMMMSASASGGDPHWANVISLLRFGGADGSTTFTDEKGISWTAYGNAQIDTSRGYNAGEFDGVGDFLSTTATSDWQFDDDICMEAWIVPRVNNSLRTIVAKRDVGTGANEWWLAVDATGVLRFIAWGAGSVIVLDLVGTTTLSTNTLHHVEIDRQGTSWVLFLNGAIEASGTESGAPVAASYTPRIGRDSTSTRDWNGWIRQFRYTKGVARHMSPFTPPAVPFPNF